VFASAAGAGSVVIIEMDMMAELSPKRTSELAVGGLGAVDILINCMGASRPVFALPLWERGYLQLKLLAWVGGPLPFHVVICG
jgi:NAD(P)-dependent dehydrogenase (short-subunit alcohol dehydrogenase family)